MRILISNDDGIDAEGIQVLYKYLAKNHEVWVVAPSEERSTTGQSLSLDKPLRLEERGDKKFACTGFPADCALMGLYHLRSLGLRPDVVVSGINKGANLAQDLYYSGTVAAARQAAFSGIPAIAVSLVLEDLTHSFFYESAAIAVDKLLTANIHRLIPPHSLININVPNLPFDQLKGYKWTKIGFREYTEDIHERMDARGKKYYWIAGQYKGFIPVDGNTDCEAAAEGFVAVTPHPLVQVKDFDFWPIGQLVSEMSTSSLKG